MAWNKTTQKQYKRDLTRYETDLTDAEWELPKPLLPPPSPRGRPRKTDLREALNAIQYILGTGMPVAGGSSMFSAVYDGSELFLCVTEQRCPGPDDGRSAEAREGAGGPE